MGCLVRGERLRVRFRVVAAPFFNIFFGLPSLLRPCRRGSSQQINPTIDLTQAPYLSLCARVAKKIWCGVARAGSWFIVAVKFPSFTNKPSWPNG